MRRFFSPIVLFYLILVAMLYIGTYGQLIRNYQAVPSDRYYYGGEEYPLDLSQNIALVRQGYEGHWRAFFNNTTSFPLRPSILKFEYILIGKFAKVFSLDPVEAYMLLRFFVSVGWFVFLYVLVLTLFKKQWQQILAFLFILFSASIYEGTDAAFVHAAVFDAQVLVRFTYSMFHYLLGGLTAMISMFCFAQSLEKGRWLRWFLVSILMGFCTSLVYGPTVILIAASLPLVVILMKHDKKRVVLLSCIYAGIILLPLVYVRFVVAIQLEEYNLAFMERLNPFDPTFVQYLLSLGFIYLLSILSLPQVLKKRNAFFVLLYGWNIVHPVGMYFLADRLNLNPIRFYLLPYYVVFGILGVLGVKTIISLIPQQLKKTRGIVVLCLAAAVLVPGLETLYRSWKQFQLCYCLPEVSSYGYPPKDIMHGLWWLRDNTKNSDIVLSDTYAGTLIPPFAGNIVYTSWWFRLSNVPKFYTTYEFIKQFFSGRYSDEEARNFLDANNIRYVFYGFQERWHSPWGGEPTYPSLRQVARFGNVVVYEVLK